MKHCTPEEIGLSSAAVLAFYREMEENGMSTHAVLMARGDRIFSECYYAPFHKDLKHRMYSVSKTFVSVAVGFCEQDGLLSLDEPMVKYFPEYLNAYSDSRVTDTTIREMLQMESSMESSVNWFRTGTDDRREVYFRKHSDKYAGTLFHYDSPGSYMLGCIVERVTGKPFLEYLKEKVLLDIGFSEDAYCLQAPGGHSFGDSGVMCTPMDLLLFARFVLNMGTFEGKRYLNEAYLRAATTMSVSNNDYGFRYHDTYGYGYQIWGAPKGCFAFLGMGTQVAVCDPKHDFIFVITSDNQGHPAHYEYLYKALYRNIIDQLGDTDAPLPANPEAHRALTEFTASQKLFSLPESTDTSFSREIDGRVYRAEENPMGIKWFRLDFSENGGTLTYENATGEKSFSFGLGYNVFGKFPEEGYSDRIATVPCPGNRYDAAFSADFPERQKLRIRVQIIDKYFGNLAMVFGFCDRDHASVRMVKRAEAFLNEYEGIMNAECVM